MSSSPSTASVTVMALNWSRRSAKHFVKPAGICWTIATGDIVTLYPSRGLMGTVRNRTVDVTAEGEVGLDLDNTSGTIAAAQLAADCITAEKLDADVATELQSGVATEAKQNIIDTVVDAIKVVTDKFVFTVANLVNANTLRISGTAAAADSLEEAMKGVVNSTAKAGTLSTTQMSTNLTEATDDHFKGRIVTWTSGVLAGQSSDITAYVGTNGVLTFTAGTDAPSATDSFVIT